MFLVLLRFSTAASKAGEYMTGHRRWLEQGFDEGVFVLSGSLQPKLGGAILAHNTSLEDLRRRVKQDPFVVADVVTSEILELSASNAIEPLRFLTQEAAR